MSFSVYLQKSPCRELIDCLNRRSKWFDRFVLTTPLLYERWFYAFVKRPTRSPGATFWSPYDCLAGRP